MCYGICSYEHWDGECRLNLDRLPADAACMQDWDKDDEEMLHYIKTGLKNNIEWLKEELKDGSD